jgi:hypothetical protein
VAGFAGLMFDVVPEPTSAVLVLMATTGIGCSVVRKRRG